MYKFSNSSKKQYNTLHPDLQKILDIAIQYYDFSILCGHRNEIDQNVAYKNGTSNLKWPDSNHNTKPSNAVDIAPYPINWEDVEEFYYLAGIINLIAQLHNIDIKWGGRFSSILDCPHFELVQDS